MGVTVYRSDDSSAPQLTCTQGSFISLLKACLVNGYGSKAAAGWSLHLEDTVNHKAIFRNNSGSGSGRYWRVCNDARPTAAQAVGSNHGIVTIKGCAAASTVDTTTGDFPRAVTGTDLHFTSELGIYQNMWYSAVDILGTPSSPPVITTVIPWVIVADEQTAWIFTYPYDFAGGVGITHLSNVSITCIGDVNRIGPNTSLPRAITLGDVTLQNPAWNDRPPVGSQTYIEFSVGTGSLSVKGKLSTETAWTFSSGTGSDQLENNPTYNPYPHPVLGGVMMEHIVVMEDAADSKRTTTAPTGFTTSISEFLTFATLRGMYANTHAINTGLTKIGDSGDYVQAGGRTYWVVGPMKATFDQARQRSLLLDITGPWS